MADDIFNFNNVTPLRREEFDKDEIKARLENDIQNVVKQLYPRVKIPHGARDVRIADPSGDLGNSMAIALTPDAPGKWIDHATGDKGDVLTLVQRALGLSDFTEVLREANALAGGTTTSRQKVHRAAQEAKPRSKPKVKIGEESYPYLSLTGEPIVTVHKYLYEAGKKEFRMFRHSDGQWKAPDVRPLYNLPGIAKADTVIFVEGEKCAQALIEKGFPATCIMGGAKAPLEKTDWSPLAGKQVIIWPDNDEPGFGLAGRVKNVLNGLSKSQRVVDVPNGKPEGWDVADAIEAGEDVTAYLGTAKKRKVPVLSVGDLEGLEPPEWLIDGVLVKGGLSTLFAPAETFKSFIALDMALSIAAGQSWRGKDTIAGPVVYLIGEGVAGWPARVFTWLKHRHEGNTPEFYTVPTSLQLNEAEEAVALVEAIQEHCETPSMIVVDTLARNFGGGDENSTQDMNAFVRSIDQLREQTGAHVMLVHHTGKDLERGGRGSSVLRAALDTELQCFRDDPDGYEVTLKITKQKDIEKADPIHFEMVKSEAVHPKTGEVIFSLIPTLREVLNEPAKYNHADHKLLDFLKERTRTTKECATYISMSERGTRKKLRRLEELGQIFSSSADGVSMWNFYDIWTDGGTE